MANKRCCLGDNDVSNFFTFHPAFCEEVSSLQQNFKKVMDTYFFKLHEIACFYSFFVFMLGEYFILWDIVDPCVSDPSPP